MSDKIYFIEDYIEDYITKIEKQLKIENEKNLIDILLNIKKYYEVRF